MSEKPGRSIGEMLEDGSLSLVFLDFLRQIYSQSIETAEEIFRDVETEVPPFYQADMAYLKKFVLFSMKVKALFGEIESGLDAATARYLFRSEAARGVPKPKELMEEFRRIQLLESYIRDGRPGQQFAKMRAGTTGIRSRKATAPAIERGLGRLLSRDPAKESNPLMRSLLRRAKQVPRTRGRQPKKK